MCLYYSKELQLDIRNKLIGKPEQETVQGGCRFSAYWGWGFGG